MNILLVSYGDYRYDGRLRQLVKVFKEIGNLRVLCQGEATEKYIKIVGKNGYGSFVKEVLSIGKRFSKIDILVVDNRRACLPALKLAKILKPTLIIQDVRELYVTKETKGLHVKFGCFIEQKMFKKADILIAANEDRANLMVKLFKLKEKPIVYENLRQLQYKDNEEAECAEKFKDYIKEGEYRILSTAGCNVERTTDILVENLNRVKRKARLFLIGNSSEEDIETIKRIIATKRLNNVEILGALNQGELKYMIENSHIGIVNYHQNDINNRLCASGKIYEFLYEGVPVVTTTNPPLKNLLDETGVGEADDFYADGINKILDNYEEYKERTIAFARENTVEDNDNELMVNLKERINKRLK